MYIYICVCACACACVRARARARVQIRHYYVLKIFVNHPCRTSNDDLGRDSCIFLYPNKFINLGKNIIKRKNDYN